VFKRIPLLLALLASSQAQAQWTYSESKDKISGEVTAYATTRSTNSERFAFPYHGGSRLNLQVRQEESGKTFILFAIDRGQFFCDLDACSVRVKFDDETDVYPVVGAADGSSDVLFIDLEDRFLKYLKQSKRLMVEAAFYREGKHTFEFKIASLRWPVNKKATER